MCYHYGSVLLMRDEIVQAVLSLPVGLKERMAGRGRILTRLLRFGVRAAIALDNEHLIISIGNLLYELDLHQGVLSPGWNCGEGIRPLVFSMVKDVTGLDDGVYFGGYLKNNNKKPVSIYHHIDVDNWDVIYTFPEGAINHIHTIVPDKFRNCLWLLTGDFGDAAAIWKVTDGFRKVERVAFGDQKWRGCVAFALPEGLLYATDTPFADNHIYLLKDDKTVESISAISGSCIYGCQWKDRFVFSSTVEADGRDETPWKLLTSKKRGKGIKDDYVRMYVGNLADGFEEVYKVKKDWLPFAFQFGVFKFPIGTNSSNTLYCQPVATSANDMKLIGMTFNI